MKQWIAAAAFGTLLLSACKKNEDADVAARPSGLTKSWTAQRFDNEDMTTGGRLMVLEFSNEHNGSGTSRLDLTFDGQLRYTEEDTYQLSEGNARITFTRKSGTCSLMADGGLWSVDALGGDRLQLTSAYGLKIELGP